MIESATTATIDSPSATEADVSGGTPPASASAPASDAPAHRHTPRRELERLGDEIARLSAHIQAATYRLLVMIRVFDARQGWHNEGFKSCARWLSWRTGLSPGAAREKVRVARALAVLPELTEGMKKGELSYSAARALTRIATPENESDLIEVARHTTAAELEKLVRSWQATDRVTDPEAERQRHAERSLTLLPDPDGGWRLRGRLDVETGAVLRAALEAASEVLYRKAGEDAECPVEARRADALGLVAEAALGAGLEATTGEDDGEAAPVVGRAERFQVVVHVPAETLAGSAADESGAIERALGIDHWTPTPDWTGERLDVDWALFTLWRPAGDVSARNVTPTS